MFGSGRSGMTGLLAIVGVLYFTNAGSWMLKQVSNLDIACYRTLQDISWELADPICGGVAKGRKLVTESFTRLGDYMDDKVAQLQGTTRLGEISALTNDFAQRVSGFASSSNTLSEMLSRGPGRYDAANSSFQQAVDSFTVGQGLLRDFNNVPQALAWLKRGAEQPQGYGLMSQLSLGNFYASGGGNVPANPALASFYFQQADQSITALNGLGTPQAQQLLKALPASPQDIQAQLQRAVRQLSVPVKP